MGRRHLFVMDPLDRIDPTHDTTFVIMNEVQRRGGDVWVCQSTDLSHENDSLLSWATRVRIGEGEAPFECQPREALPASDFDLVWMREDPPFDQAYLHATYLLSRCTVPVINDPDGIRSSNEKMFILDFPEHIPDTWVGTRVDPAMEFLGEMDEVVAKTLSGFGGEEVYRLSQQDENVREILQKLTEQETRTMMIQEYLPSVTDEGDRRIIVLGGEPIGGLTRLPASGDFRANLHSGGEAGEVYLTDEERAICRDLKPELLRRGLYLVGLDLIGNKIVEINVTSPTCVQEINPHVPDPLEEKIVDFADNQLSERIDSYVG